MILETNRLILRTWMDDDIDWFAALNADEQVMEHFPATLTHNESLIFLKKLQVHQSKYGYCYFALVEKQSGAPVGFTGMAYQDYKSLVTPAIDIGWRLKTEYWGKGYATEAANAILATAKRKWNINRLIATTVPNNVGSINIMKKIGMNYMTTFDHPKLIGTGMDPEIIVYEIDLEGQDDSRS